MTQGLVFDIAEGTLHDGPGLRITVFLKGCPLRCRWCHSPEGQSTVPQDLQLPNGMHRHCGQFYSPEGLATRLNAMIPLLPEDGGITFSGGEPLLQASFLCETLKLLAPVHTIADTCGCVSHDSFSSVAPRLSYLFFGLKIVDENAAKAWTGHSSSLPIQNLHWLDETCATPYRLRIPLLHGVTDTREQWENLAQLWQSLKRRPDIDFLPSNPNAGAKYASCGMTFSPGFDVTAPAEIPVWFKESIPCRLLAADAIE